MTASCHCVFTAARLIYSKKRNCKHKSRNEESVVNLLHGIRSTLSKSSGGTRSIAEDLTSGRSNNVWKVQSLTNYLPRDGWRTFGGDSIHNRYVLESLADRTWKHCHRRERCGGLMTREATLCRIFSNHTKVRLGHQRLGPLHECPAVRRRRQTQPFCNIDTLTHWPYRAPRRTRPYFLPLKTGTDRKAKSEYTIWTIRVLRVFELM